jgi:hypothetical protein
MPPEPVSKAMELVGTFGDGEVAAATTLRLRPGRGSVWLFVAFQVGWE